MGAMSLVSQVGCMDAERNAPAPREGGIPSDFFAAWDWCIALRIHAPYKLHPTNLKGSQLVASGLKRSFRRVQEFELSGRRQAALAGLTSARFVIRHNVLRPNPQVGGAALAAGMGRHEFGRPLSAAFFGRCLHPLPKL